MAISIFITWYQSNNQSLLMRAYFMLLVSVSMAISSYSFILDFVCFLLWFNAQSVKQRTNSCIEWHKRTR